MAEGSTLAAVAARAGVSIASASRALNGGIASTSTIARVQQAADDLGYRPNLMARGLQSGRTGQVAMLVPDAANPVYARMMSALQSELDAHGIRLLMQQVPAEPVDAVAALSAGLVDGAIVGAATSQISYTASKGGVLAMTRELGVEFARHGVRVNALCPGPVNTPLLQELYAKDEEKAARRLVHLPMGRFARAEEIAAGALFLAGDESSYVTASTFLVDGGISGAYVTPL